jgi:hypothetical protein
MDWGAWSRECVSLMAARTRDLLARHRIAMGSRYHWDLDAGVIEIGGVPFRLVTVGTVAGDSFLWSWANDLIPAGAKLGIDKVQQFGVENDLGLLSEPCAPGGLAQGKECLVIAGRVLDAHGIWIDETDDGFILFVLYAQVRH